MKENEYHYLKINILIRNKINHVFKDIGFDDEKDIEWLLKICICNENFILYFYWY